MRHESSFALEYGTESAAAAVERSLRPEIGDIEGDRTAATLSRDGATVGIDVAAADLVALRAGQNTWLSLAGVAERVLTAGVDAADETDTTDPSDTIDG
ncbi:KEOPS complex subunit Pcc1 [Halococcus thailandensis]|uniref:KEOPS complex Pcc1-like subunit n=1 Tax=Halococcus thailandensis JCM 13552 TaxID=1227457 RepID=M0NAF9_9EURY|nr:KEOPS complex subunit Pcc1 [Halococcus thailandensis]EMA54074.1 KEOPS complex Pcc1-like subunit [Halococcus thailandensis JCM 13552]